jgi:hypothetical protein
MENRTRSAAYVEMVELFDDAANDARLMRAVEVAEEQRELLRRLARRQPCRQRSAVANLIRGYEETTGTCVCCD